eukprot:Phypoly_transcript_16893.p1 GENE.Phypoly_transcript_16893~~Phypoly_transcript_16893.p1  ORF type:complete len:186 (+),score=32.81 Phypoly_transcript_16893:188-745(+)
MGFTILFCFLNEERQSERDLNKEVAMQEFEEFIDKHGGASRGDPEAQYEDPINKKSQKVDNIMHQLDSTSIGYRELDKADRNIDARGAASKEILDNFDGYNLKHHTYEGVNLAEQSPVRNEEDKRAQDPFLCGVASRRSGFVSQKRHEGHSEMVNSRDFAIPPEDSYPTKTDQNVAPDMDIVDPY